MQLFLVVLVSLLASTVGAIAGIGGGVIIKPVLDSLQMMDVSTISFLSGCTVLSMSMYNAVKSYVSKDRGLRMETALPLGVGAALGGVSGKYLFSYIKSLFENSSRVGAVQAVCLIIVTVLTFIYTLKPSIIRSRQVKNAVVSIVTGLLLGLISAFLGIGGGPINLMVLSVLYSMNMKDAAKNSLIVIFISQLASLIATVATRTVPSFDPLTLALMVVCGILGGMLGRKLNKKMSSENVKVLFLITMAVIILLSIKNLVYYLG